MNGDYFDKKALRDASMRAQELFLYTAAGQSLSLRDWYKGKSAFLILNGPSLAELDLSLLRSPGIVTMGVNNGWFTYRPNLWVAVDDPTSFADVGWKDPAITKFIPMGKVDERLRTWKGGKFMQSQWRVGDMPATFFFPRNEHFDPKTYMAEKTVNWGQHGKKKDAMGIKGSRSVMLAALKLLYYLGFRTVYLIGADFRMEFVPDKTNKTKNVAQNYAFEQGRTKSSVSGNNSSYDILKKRFTALLPEFEKRKFKVINCTPGGALDVFPRMPYEEGIKAASEEASKEVPTTGWYEAELNAMKKPKRGGAVPKHVEARRRRKRGRAVIPTTAPGLRKFPSE